MLGFERGLSHDRQATWLIGRLLGTEGEPRKLAFFAIFRFNSGKRIISLVQFVLEIRDTSLVDLQYNENPTEKLTILGIH